jgi:pyruvate kinase
MNNPGSGTMRITTGAPWTTETLATGLAGLLEEMLRIEGVSKERIARLHPSWQASARNLLDYLTLRRQDVRPLQDALAERGLSSLGRAEAHVCRTIESVLELLRLSGATGWSHSEIRPLNREEGRRLLETHANALLGPPRDTRTTRIMVTLPPEAADDPDLVRALLENGMEIARINCAHDGEAAWARMVANVRREAERARTPCRILMDLAGPKLRTGPMSPGPAVVKIRPTRDDYGRVIEPARVCLTPIGAPEPSTPVQAALPVPGDWLARCAVGDVIGFSDARGSERSMTVSAVAGEKRHAKLLKTAYVLPGTRLDRRGPDGDGDVAAVGQLPARPGFIPLRRGDHLVLTREALPGVPARIDGTGRVLAPARISCTLPEVFRDVRPGEGIWFDDGLIRGVVRNVTPAEILVEIVSTRPHGGKLQADKGINLPDSELHLPALTEADLRILPFIAKHADSVGLSFVHEPADVRLLQDRLAELHGEALGVVLKIETRRAFERLPDLLLAAMRSPCVGAMIARGDLAVECGYERLAEVQEEILWICEAAHVPVIWATQVLESLAKDGVPSRAEITDAAMGRRAECVMLNKGPHVCEAVRVLDSILERMQAHQYKKTAMLRKLRLAQLALDTEARRPDPASTLAPVDLDLGQVVPRAVAENAVREPELRHEVALAEPRNPPIAAAPPVDLLECP